jgi:hypothetical protein
MPSNASRPRRYWHLAAVVALVAAAPLNMWGWVEKDVIPPADHPGYIAVVQQLWNNLAHYGRVPAWLPDQLGGTSHFTSDLKEFLALPFVLAFGPTHGYFLLLALCKILAAASLSRTGSGRSRTTAAPCSAIWTSCSPTFSTRSFSWPRSRAYARGGARRRSYWVCWSPCSYRFPSCQVSLFR